jgi:hypothetical protein
MSVETLHTAASIRRPGNTYKALLADTRDLLRGLHYATPEDSWPRSCRSRRSTKC